MNNHCGNCCNNCRGELCASKVPIFENLNNEELLKIVNTINHKEYAKGMLFSQREMWLIRFFL